MVGLISPVLCLSDLHVPDRSEATNVDRQAENELQASEAGAAAPAKEVVQTQTSEWRRPRQVRSGNGRAPGGPDGPANLRPKRL